MNQHTLVGADFHVSHNHAAILKGRGFSTIQEHDDSFHQFLKGKKDKGLIFLGDLSLRSKHHVNTLLEQLSDSFHNVIFIYGNHDQYVKKFVRANARHMFNESVYKNMMFMQELTCDLDKIRFNFSHFPKQVWDKQRYGGIHIHGHCHGAIQTSRPESSLHRALDAGYESIKRWAIPMPEILNIMETKQILNT